MEYPSSFLEAEVVGGKYDREATIQSYMSECGYTKKQAISQYDNMKKLEDESRY
jgi:hypothetical protein